MTISQLFEQDSPILLEKLRSVGSPAEASGILTEELSGILLAHNAQCDSQRVRRDAAALLDTAGHCLPLLDTQGEVKLWTWIGKSTAFHLPPTAGLLFLAAIILGVLVCFDLLPGLVVRFALLLLSLLMCAAATYLTVKTNTPEKEYRAEATTDWQKALRCLQAAALTIDQFLAESASLEQQERQSGQSSVPLETDTLELLGQLLEAGRSGDGDFALERLRQLEPYLYGHGLTALDYAPDCATYFDVLPGMERATLRPALLREGRLIQRGLAVDAV